jgi:hypothetical protein
MYPAGNGDAFLLSAAGTNILVDGGYPQTFNEHIAHDLSELSSKGENLDLLITSHIDADHISGLIRFLSLNGSSDSPRIVPIRNIWHNSLRSLTVKSDARIQASDQEILEAIHRRGHSFSAEIEQTESSATEISARQGSSLASLIHDGGYQWNGSDGTTKISVEHTGIFNLRSGKIHVIAPTQQRLSELLKWWKKQLRRMGYKGATDAGSFIDDAFEFICEHAGESATSRPVILSAGSHKSLEDAYEPDSSITNGSSIATIIELGGVRILMLADAWAEDTVQVLRELQLQGCSMVFDAIKISHHGSLRNTSPELLQLVDAPRYIVSSNGAAHGHPDIEVLTAIVDRPAPFTRTLYFNYATPASNAIRNHQSKAKAPFTVLENVTNWIEIEEGLN